MSTVTSAQIRVPVGEWLSAGADETFSLGSRIGKELSGCEILLLSGALGAGKTILVNGIAAALGINREEVTSPSFTLVNPHEGRLLLYPIDLYRLDAGVSAAHAVDLDELLTNEKAVIVIEWAERLGDYRLPDSVWRVGISGDGDDPRTVSIRTA